MTAKKVFMGYCLLYAVVRFIATTVYYFSGNQGLQLAVLIIAEVTGLIGIVAGIRWIARRNVPAVMVRGLLLLYSAAAITNIFITRANPLPHGVASGDLLIIGTLFDLLLFLVAVLIPMPDTAKTEAVKTASAS